MIKILTADNVWLDVLDKTEISFEENSKFFDSNIFQFDFSSTVDLPFSPNNNLFFANLTDGKALVSVYSDGIFVDKYYLKLLSKKENITKNTGSYNVEFNSIYDTINDEFGKKYLPDLVQYEDTIAFPNMNTTNPEDTTLLDWLANEQLNPRDVPYRFPQYSLIKDIDGEMGIAETLNKNFGNIIECNFFDWQSPHPGYGNTREFYYHRGVVYNGYYPNGDKNNTNWLDFPIRPWSIAVPCFNYIWVMREALKIMGYELQIEYKSKDIEDKINNIVMLNNYNILNFKVLAERQEKIKEITAHDGTLLNTNYIYSKLSIWDWDPNITIKAKNHLPKVTISDLILDFVIKTGCELKIDGNTVKLSVFDLNKIDGKSYDFDPNIERKFNNILNTTILKYEYKEDKNTDNIPNYEIKGNSDNSNEVVSIFCPVLHKKSNINYGSGDVDVQMSYIIASPNIDSQLCEIVLRKANYKYTKTYDTDEVFVGVLFEEENSIVFVTTNSIDPYCAFSWMKSGTKNANFLLKLDKSPNTIFLFYRLQAFDFIEDFSLHWEDDSTKKGVVSNFYKDKFDLFKARNFALVKSKFSPSEFYDFSHYAAINLQGKKHFPLRRKYTLPFSKNPIIEYDAYEPALN